MAVIYLVRHGQASFGAADYDALSELGRQQARLAGQELAGRVRKPLRVSGTLRRQKDTATLLGPPGAVHDVIEDSRWNEYDHLQLIGRYAEAADFGGADSRGTDPGIVRDSRAFQTHLDSALGRWIEQGPGGGWDSFVSGAVEALHALPDRLVPGQDAVVVTSGGVIAAAVGSLLAAPAPGIVALNRVMVNASITAVLAGSSGLNLLSFNEHAHLGAARTYR
ncbi:histidine phosphatase family protein [Planosporangium sp. 12N6]|uniref:histidine phosphatase family protein n=1 Tax=Planosporangium spinosum TaxID=3402278 RepID=UPI003CE978B1